MFLIDREGDWWIGSKAGVLRYRGVRDPRALAAARPVATYTRRDGLAADVVIRLFEDSRGDVWIATVGEGQASGLSRWRRSSGTFDHFDAALPLGQYFVAALCEDPAGGIWIGLSGGAGLARYRDGRFTRVGHGAGGPTAPIRNLSIDSRGRLWVPTWGGGLVVATDARAEHPAFTTYTTARGLSSDWVTAIAEEAHGRIVVATARGIDRLDPTTGRVLSYPAGDGLPVGEMFAALRDRGGRVWLTSLFGVLRIESIAEAPLEPPAVLLTRVQAAERAVPTSALGQPGLPPLALRDGRNLHIEFVAPTSGPADGVRYQVKVLSTDGAWDPPSTHRSVTYANLAPGPYRFAVRAINADGVPGPEAGFAFVVPTPIWRRWWFVSLALLMVAGTGHGFYRRRLNRLLELARVRARIATDLHDDVGANLTRIAVLSEVARRQAAGASLDGQLASIAAVARESVASMSDIVWAISPDRDNLSELVRRMREYASEVFADVTLTFEGPPDTDPSALAVDVRREVFMIFKEAANNAARHSACSRARITLHVDASRLLLSVADDGAGFDSDDVRDGNGLASMRQRARRIGGTLEVTSAPGAGTVVRFELPVTRLRHPPEWVGDTAGART
jgi:two-component sensor histidine kinase/streptogramin lyase